MELMRGVGGNIHRVACPPDCLLATEGCFDLAFEQNECLLEVVTVRRRSAPRRNVHIDDAETATGVVAADGDRVGVADQADVRQRLIGVRLSGRERAPQIVGGNRRADNFPTLNCCAAFEPPPSRSWPTAADYSPSDRAMPSPFRSCWLAPHPPSRPVRQHPSCLRCTPRSPRPPPTCVSAPR